MNKVGYLAAFAVGAVIGAAATWLLVKNKYENEAQETINKELDTIRTIYNGKEKVLNEELEQVREEKEIVVKKLSAINSVRKEPTVVLEPRVISPEEFEENEDEYEQITLYYYKDKVLADMNDNIIEDVDGIVGLDNLKRIGEWEDDVIHIRNDGQERDYEILQDYGCFNDLVVSKHDPEKLEEYDQE